MPPPDPLVPALQAKAHALAHPTPEGRCTCEKATLADRPDATVVRHGTLVAKAHTGDTDPTELSARLAAAAHPTLGTVLLPPLHPFATTLHDRQVTLWPPGTPVDPDTPEAAPWEAAATLLARLHRVPPAELPHPLPDMRGPEKSARALARLRAAGPHPAAAPVERAWGTLPPWARAETRGPARDTVCHGDFHLGQLVRAPGEPDRESAWRLIDVDDLGLGNPAWDLARPAAWYACGLLAPEEWTRFLTAYQQAGGPAVPPPGTDPWPALDVPARALTIQTAALAIAKAVTEGRLLDEVEQAVIDTCDRMATLPPEFATEQAK
ncbi:phosphotransferase family protein [Streptomyces sp. NPDC059009]|uniref:phosphotransferase family protein n=1 Tax=Streptomyces sp. NPDC059009 TaxID=3346694 RepID=UPI0036B322DF